MNNSINTTPAGGGVGQSPANLLPPPLHLSGASGQRAANLNLRQIDQSPTLGDSPLSGDRILPGAGGLSGQQQPLSPTQTSSNKQSSRILKEDKKQKALKGPPQHVGMTTLDYEVTQKSAIVVREVTANDVQINYLKDIYDEATVQASDFPFKSISEQFAPGETYQRIELTLTLPFDMAVEQIEMSISNHELFSKYLKLLKIETHNTDSPMIHLRGGFYDQQKRIFELNTCGLTNQVKLVFLYNFDLKPKSSTSCGGLRAPRGESAKLYSQQSNAQNVSDRIKNEIIPLLNVASNDDEMDELDDEVAMISNKKATPDPTNVSGTGIISSDDIKIEIKAATGGDNSLQRQNAKAQQQQQLDQAKKTQQQQQTTSAASEEEFRNFNTLPRNYSESQVKEGIQQQPELVAIIGANVLANAEQEIFQNSELSNQSASLHQAGEVTKLLIRCITQIKIIGFNINHIPAITSLTCLMNNSFLLKREGHHAEAQEFDFINGVLMISSKRYTQAVEIFRKIQASHLSQIEAKMKDTQGSQKNPQQHKVEVNKLFVKCALLELLTAESMCQAPQINDKLMSMKRMCDLFQGKSVPVLIFTPQIHLMDDPYTTILKLLPVFLKFVLMCITHKKEIVRLSSMKLLEFILETKGCSLDSSMVFILKAILTTYPSQSQPSSASVNTSQSQGAQQQSQSKIEETQIKAVNVSQDSFCIGTLSQSVQEYFQYSKKHPQQSDQRQDAPFYTEFKAIKEPNSGYQTALKNVYNHVLETYISVLSSISSHILHQLFYEVIIPTITSATIQPDVKIFAIKIAEKIITICQGDLILGKPSLEYFLTTVSQKLAANASADHQLFQTNLRNLWGSIRTKVFANYSQKGLKSLIDWLVDKMSIIAQNAGINNKEMIVGTGMSEDQIDDQSNPDISKLEITEEEGNQLQQIFDIISVISISRKKNEEEANSHIKIKQDYILELYLLINPLLFWLDFSVEREERFGLFKSVYQTIKDVLENLPPKRIDIDLLQIMIPILQRTTEFLRTNSPSLSMLKFLEIVLRDIKSGGYCQMQTDLQYFFLEMLKNFVSYISYCLYEEVFSVFDKLLFMCADVINEQVLTKCILALVDKYTMKSKSHKNSLQQFMKLLMEVKVRNRASGEKRGHHSNNNNIDSDDHEMDDDQISVHSKNNYFEIMCNFCFFNNDDTAITAQQRPIPFGDFKNPTDLHDLYIDKMQFYIDSLALLTEIHVNLFTLMIMHPKFKSTILALLQKGELSLRLKCHEILEVVTNYYSQFCVSKTVYELALPQPPNQLANSLSDFQAAKKKQQQSEVMEVEYINQERLYLAQIVVQCIKISLDQKSDSYLQFNSLILLDFLFQNLLPVPNFQNEQFKDKVTKSNAGSSKSNQNQSINNFGSHKGGNSNDSFVLDLETADINETTPEFEVTQRGYMLMRLNLIFKLWPYVTQALNSAWSNIRSICYGLICSMLKIDIRDFQSKADQPQSLVNQQFLLKLKQIVLPMLVNLLSSKESESKAGGLNILGSFCGLSYDFSQVKISRNLDFFRKNSQFISLSIWQLVFDLQDDWDITIKEASVVLIQLCAPRDAVKYFDKVKRERENIKFQNMMNRYGMGPGGDQSSRLSSSRGHVDVQMQFLNSATSMNGDNEDMLSGIPGVNGNKEKGGNILSFLSGTADEMSLVFQMDQNHQNAQQMQQLNSSAEIPDHAGPPGGHKSGINRNDKKIISSASEEIMKVAVAEEAKKHSYLADFDDGLQFQDLMEHEGIDPSGISHFNFFVDKYADEQIQEIISIFRNDFKPPKNLWIEKNPSVAFNSPDYYAEIFSSAIDQFNQQQMKLQQQQQEQLQIQLSSSPKSSQSKSVSNMVDALEDDLVKKYENEKKEKEKLSKQANAVGNAEIAKDGPSNFMIFERHFEDKSEEEGAAQDSATGQIEEELKKEDLSMSSSGMNNQSNSETCSIDAEPFQFLDSPKAHLAPPKEKPKKDKPQQLQILDDGMASGAPPKSKSKEKSPNIAMVSQQHQQHEGRKSKGETISLIPHTNASKKTTDELIEEYERKINKTKSLLEEEKKRVATKQYEVIGESINIKAAADDNLTPEFKGKTNDQSQLHQSIKMQLEDQSCGPPAHSSNHHSRDSKGKKASTQPPQLMHSNQLQSYLTDFTNKNYLSGQDNAKLLKQIKNCFNDTSYANYALGAVTMSTTPQGGPVRAGKQKLNKSYENLLAANKNKAEVIQNAKSILGKKNLSTSPRRGSSSGKKVGSSRVNKKKYLQQQQVIQINQQNYVAQDLANPAAGPKSGRPSAQMQYNMKDLNFFIKTIEKDLSDKFTKNLKDFNSMPTTPTSILKKVEDQMKALAQNKEAKAQMSNTCPNIAQILSTLDSHNSKSVGIPSSASANNGVKGVNTGTETHRQAGSGANLLHPGHHLANFQTIGTTLNNGPNNNSLSNYPGSAMSYNSVSNHSMFDKFQFSKTQKIDMKDAKQGIFGYQIPIKDGNTHRDLSGENRQKNSLSPLKDEKQHYANLLKQSKHHKKSGKRSRGSTDKYLLLGGGVGAGPQAFSAVTGAINYGSSSSSYTKLNKSANNIQAGSQSSATMNPMIGPLTSVRKREQAPSSSSLSQQLINSFAKANNMSPNNKKLLQQMVKHQFVHPGTTPHTNQTHSAGIPITVSGTNTSMVQEFSDANTKRGMQHPHSQRPPGQQSSSREKEKTPNKQLANIKPSQNGIELSPIAPIGDEKYSAGLKINHKQVAQK